jgi:NADH dehydrogenase/GIY-YIG catalytic domain
MKLNLFVLYTSIIEPLYQVLSVLIPMLLCVAFMTIIERKQLAAHQRRVGPTEVGYKINKNKMYCLPNKVFKRFYHGSSDNNKDIIDALFINRVIPVKKFDSQLLDTCYNLTLSKEKSLFFNKFKDKGGIYLFQYKENPLIYYIGRTKNFKSRLTVHLKIKVKDKFHLFANLVG